MAAAMPSTRDSEHLRRQRAGVRRTVWICVAVVVVLLGLFVAQYMV